MTEGLLDTNLFIHAQSTDLHSDECRRFLAALEQGNARARLEPLVLHELSYVLPHYLKQLTREQIAQYLLSVLSWVGVEGDIELMVETVQRWGRTPRLSFVDAYLAARATELQCPVYTQNVRELVGQGIEVPQPLPSGPVS
jgi:predicted nucleic acid-binding protein